MKLSLKYINTIHAIKTSALKIATTFDYKLNSKITLDYIDNIDGRLNSSILEKQFLNELKLDLETNYDFPIQVIISKDRSPEDIIINNIKINLKLTKSSSPDNAVNKHAIFYSITGISKLLNGSNWNDFLKLLKQAKQQDQIKTTRNKETEYHYLVIHKIHRNVLLKSIFDIHTYLSSSNNELQINWRKEFKNSTYECQDNLLDYNNKIKQLLSTIQHSILKNIEKNHTFATDDLSFLNIQQLDNSTT